MVKRLKYVNYTVTRNGEEINSGSIPDILTFSGGSGDYYNLGGIWLWFRYPDLTTLTITDPDTGESVSHPSSRTPHSLRTYLANLYGDENILRTY